MSLYKKDAPLKCDVSVGEDGKINIDFSSDCGKFGTSEPLAFWGLSPERLYQISNERKDISDKELDDTTT